MSSSTNPHLSRRSLLGAFGLITAGVSLASCGSGSSGTGAAVGAGEGAAKSAALKLPTYKEFAGAAPDFPGSAEGLQAGYRKMPTPVASTTAPPLKGRVTALSQTFDTVAPGMKDNAYWQRLNAALGGELDMQIVIDDYPAKHATILASDDLPDLMWLPPNQGIPNVAPMLEAKFQDLTPYLSGDAVLEYPNLAALKPESWKTAIVNGKIWGAPIPSTPFGQVMHGNKTMWDQVGGLQCSSGAEFMEKVKELNDPARNVFALQPAYINVLHMVSQWFGVLVNWMATSDGTLVHRFETDQFKAALDFTSQLFRAGVFYPDANVPDISARLVNGTVAAEVNSGPHDSRKYWDLKPDAQTEILVPFAFEAGITPIYNMGYGTVGFTPFKKADEGKIRELLSLVNWLSAPFGTTEFLQKNYGTEGEDYTLDSEGNPVLNKSGLTNIPGVRSALNIMTSPENVLFFPGHADDVEYVHQQEQKLIAMGWRSATAGTFSDANTKYGPTATSAFYDKVVDIVTGRAKLSELDAAVARWKKDGGDRIRKEYEAVLPEDVRIFPI
ncbi:sugar ABC transporter substrate-binding protein [Intrasporangium calvum]|uniref:Sugar ABC transporter substrate-binding protein n=1 Tax=Intrasporangium calvum TaxID=53358 RepID=A0ABT5GIZ5_9MICO|nr:sugar ABC transporter substrate-binding protein [Intrasporangium calvum]MDC5698217.1 sugar ABC transporter substrate-binding protein [Intrasporangium calvum]